ncbi:MAG: acyl-CoA thioesterase [Gammaproteobacteria bacterium]|nr:acyl-CoA thioesterase [Gammaproteobacteria bacterium]
MTESLPQGEVMIQTLAMPRDTNPNGDVFGGWLVSQMDLAAGVMAKKLTAGRVVTVAIHSMSFLRPVHVGDIVICHVKLEKQGVTSLTLAVEVWVEQPGYLEKYRVTHGTFVFVAVDDAGKPRKIGLKHG